jgi:hypothetical protein
MVPLGETPTSVSLQRGRPQVRSQTMTVRNIALALLGAAAFVLKRSYAGVGKRVIHAYAGNLLVSFALYFAVLSAMLRYRHPRLLAAAITFSVVTAFELTNGFGVMANVYDPFDIAANAAGIGFAVLVDLASWRLVGGRSQSPAGGHPTSTSP